MGEIQSLGLHLRNIPAKFHQDCPNGFGDVLKKLWTTDEAERTLGDHKSSPMTTLCLGELKRIENAMLVMSNFSFSNCVCGRLVLRKNKGLSGKELTLYHTILTFKDPEKVDF